MTMTGTAAGLQGCVKKVKFGRRSVSLVSSVEPELVRSVGVVECSKHPCRSLPCRNGGDCRVDREGGATCHCVHPYTGTELADEGGPSLMLDNVTGGHCQKKRGACDPNPCKGGGDCRKIAGGFRCQCRAGRRGRLCQEEVMLADQGGEGGGGGGVRFTGNMSVRIDNRVSRR